MVCAWYSLGQGKSVLSRPRHPNIFSLSDEVARLPCLVIWGNFILPCALFWSLRLFFLSHPLFLYLSLLWVLLFACLVSGIWTLTYTPLVSPDSTICYRSTLQDITWFQTTTTSQLVRDVWTYTPSFTDNEYRPSRLALDHGHHKYNHLSYTITLARYSTVWKIWSR